MFPKCHFFFSLGCLFATCDHENESCITKVKVRHNYLTDFFEEDQNIFNREVFMSGTPTITLDRLTRGQSAIIIRVGGDRVLRRRLLDMGLVHGETVTLTGTAPLGDPLELTIKGYHLSLRKSDAHYIQVEPIDVPS